ncbi:MAG: ATP-binding protein, partial [Gemmatimonadales bacterium]
AMPSGGRVVLRTQTLEVGPGQRLDGVQRPIEPGAYAELVVRDTGEGIAPEHLPRVFEPFFTTKEVGRGTGLGLATVEGIVSQSRGHVQIESAPGDGTTVKVLLPLVPEPSPTPPAGSSLDSRRKAHERLLVVDDEQAVRNVIVRALRGEGYEVLEAGGGKQAIACMEEVGGSVDLVITDIVMPVMGGRELARELERRYPAIPLVWISGPPREAEFPEPADDQDHPFLQKPIPIGLLLETVAGALRRSSGRG